MKWPKFTGLLAGGVALLAGAFYSGQQTAPVSEPEVHQVSVITQDGRDFNGLVVNGKLLEHIQTAAPLMTWENTDLRQKNQMTWCLDRLPDEESKAVARELLTVIYGWYQNLPMWREGCSGTNYYVDDTAQDDCGIGDNAVGCAVYWGPQALTISFNGNLYDQRLSLLGVASTLAHELGHAFNLGHVACEHPEPSNMSPIYLPDGPACAAQGTREPIKEDFRDAESDYGLETWVPVKLGHIVTQVWAWNEAEDPANPDDDWIVETLLETDVSVPGYRWVVTIVDGEYGPFVEVRP